MQEKLLLLLADKLDETDPRWFHMGHWFGAKYGNGPVTEGAQPGDCGTVCCAIGLASTIPEIRERGLALRIRIGTIGSYRPFLRGEPFLGEEEAIAKVFEIDNIVDVSYLFMPGAYEESEFSSATTPQIVAARIRDFVAKGGQHADRTRDQTASRAG